MSRRLYFLVAAALSTSSLALAAHGPGGPFARWDRDGSGIVTRDEMRTAALEHFDQVDKNHDGRVTPDEAAAFASEQAEQRFADKDKNHDGQLSRDEVPHMPDKMFARLDKNGDGKLSREEFSQAHGRFMAFAQWRFTRMDTNHDGVISRDEALSAADWLFSKLDANGDGMLTKDEAKAGLRALAHKFHGGNSGSDAH